ncbi:MAG: secretin N-terminal domain-containing protein [Planctomycetota bacterium]|nr:secretin N-terminal domain-containing protein [Planctomycetota bacterium]
MKRKHANRKTYTSLLAALLAIALWSPAALAQDGRPDPASPESQGGEDAGRPAPAGAGEPSTRPDNGAPGRRVDPDGDRLVKLAFDDVGVKETIPFIAEMTGKVVMPVNLLTLQNKKITLVNDEPIEKTLALDMLIQAFRLNQIGVIEKKDVVIIGNLDELMTWKIVPVLPAGVDIMDREDKGTLVLKLFQVEEVAAEDIGDLIGENLPSHAVLSVDANSNQIAVYGDIALCQHLQELIEELDHTYIEPKTQTFRLAYADATEISENILDLFEDTGTGGSDRRSPQQRRPRGRRVPQAPVGGSPIGPEIPLRVTVNVQQNSVTVTGDPSVVDEIEKLISEEWDLPRSPGTSKIYTLVYTDPLKVADKLNALLGQGGGTTGSRRTVRPGGQGASNVSDILSGIFRIEAYPDTSQLLVFSKTEESLDFLDEVIASLDQPTSIGLPFVVELKHASAVELAEQLNALLAEAGSGATIRAPEEGLTGQSISEMGSGTGGGTTGSGGSGQAGTLNFPWQRGGRQREDQSPESPLIGKIRIVPIIRQNALAILCPRPHQEAVQELISFFDRPGRQVMISVIIAEVSLTDDLVLGWRLSNAEDILGGSLDDFRLGGTVGIEGTEDEPFESLFDTSVLNANISLNLVIQALQQESDLRVIQQPVVFTADNQEAFFFDGQEIPFITQTTINSQGNPTDSFEYKEVGVILNVRPRITVQRDVDMELRLELSATVPGVTLFGGAIIDKRLTTTHVIVQNGQTVVLSGILRERESKITRGIPLLKDIPLIGELFKHRENQTTQVELLAFVTPYVVDNPEQSDETQFEYLQRLDEMLRPVEQQRRNHKEIEDRVNLEPPSGRPEGRPLPEDADDEPEPPVDVDDLDMER